MYDLALEDFFCSKNVLASSVGSEGLEVLSEAELVRMSCQNSGLRCVSNFFFVTADDSAWLIIESETS